MVDCCSERPFRKLTLVPYMPGAVFEGIKHAIRYQMASLSLPVASSVSSVSQSSIARLLSSWSRLLWLLSMASGRS